MGRLFTRVRYSYYFMRFKSHGRNIVMSRGGLITRPEEVQLGSNIFIARNFLISARDLKIGSDVLIGPNLVIECDDHRYDVVGVTMYQNSVKRTIGGVIIENDVWIGANVTILRGAKISEGCVVGAGSVVTHNLPPYTVCVGVPCRPMKRRFDLSTLKKHLETVQDGAHRHVLEDVASAWASANLL